MYIHTHNIHKTTCSYISIYRRTDVQTDGILETTYTYSGWLETCKSLKISRLDFFTITTVSLDYEYEKVKRVGSMRFVTVITQFQVTVVTNCRALTYCVNVIYVVCQERASSLFFQYILSILWILIKCWCGYVKCIISIIIWRRRFAIDCLCVLFLADGVKFRPRCIIRQHVGLGRKTGENKGS
jgi:hypothetical protein